MNLRYDWKTAAVLISTGLAIAITVYFHVILDSQYVFTHFNYVPIILATYLYGRRGMAVPVTLVGILLVTDLISLDGSSLFNDLIRSTIMVLVGLVVASMREVSKREEAEIELKNMQLSEAGKIAHMGNWTVDVRENNITWSEEVFKIFGRDPSSYRPRAEDFLELLSGEDREKVPVLMDRSVRESGHLDTDVKIVWKDGTARFVYILGEAKYGPDGEIVKASGIVQDITERKNVEEKLRMMNAKFDLVVSIIRHDMKNLLTATAGFLELSKSSKTDENRERYVDKGLNVLGRLNDVIEETKDFQSIGTSMPVWNDVGSILSRFEGAVEETGRKLDVQTDGVEIFSSPVIEKVLYNLIENSLRHGEGATFVRFRIEDHENFTALICEDDGPGVLNEEKEMIFNKGVGKNTGLGLFFAKEALALDDITIEEKGTYGQGAKFVLMVRSSSIRKRTN
ncbi:MAG: PAS domain-containing protein [Euryarchaeota archaeon]|nr:PAS domain-containing protein [Euryarchaeota archaeon]